MEGRLWYTETGFDQSSGSSDTATSLVNVCRDLSLANRKNMEMTTRKGVPLVYHCKLSIFRNMADRPNSSLSATVTTAQTNWVIRNAAVKLHAARKKMFSNAGISSRDLGRYSKTIRYAWSSASETYDTPIFGDGNTTFTAPGTTTGLGEWDLTKIAIDDDADLVPALFGTVTNEESAINALTFNLGNAYLNSRKKIEEDDLIDADGPADHSILRSMFNVEDSRDDELIAIAEDNQDKPPYDEDAVAGTYTSKAIAGVAMTGNWGAVRDEILIDVPFGLMYIDWSKIGDSSGDLSNDITFTVEVLGVSEMQG